MPKSSFCGLTKNKIPNLETKIQYPENLPLASALVQIFLLWPDFSPKSQKIYPGLGIRPEFLAPGQGYFSAAEVTLVFAKTRILA
jgi:hypothetical protein